jgi:indoleacetamide hydrolase
LQETYRRAFREHGVDALVFPTTPLPAATIGEDYTVMLNGVPVRPWPPISATSAPAVPRASLA